MYSKKDYTNRNNNVSEWCNKHVSDKCSSKLKQTKIGSLRVICTECKTKFQLRIKK